MKTNIINLKIFNLVLITGLILTSCSKDPEPANVLTGIWTAANTTLNTRVGTQTLTQYFTDVLNLTNEEALSYDSLYSAIIKESFVGTIQIKSDNTYTSNLGGYTDTGTWTMSADLKKLTINSTTDGPTTFDIVELTSTELQLQISESFIDDLNFDGIPELITFSILVSFNK